MHISRRSTSLHTINGDNPLGKRSRIAWRFCNLLNNHLFPHAAGRLAVDCFRPDMTRHELEALNDPGASPSRLLTDLFLARMDWDTLARLGRLHVLDTGCGSGVYLDKLSRFSGGRVSQYLGLDARPNDAWPQRKERYAGAEFCVADCAKALEHIPPSANFFLSVSALEHFEHDLAYFRQVRSFVREAAHPIVHLHFVPSGPCIDLYRRHGVRQYVPRTLASIAKMLADADTRAAVYALGGPSSIEVHLDWITRPLMDGRGDLRQQDPDGYARARDEAVLADLARDCRFRPAFYALFMVSHHRAPLTLIPGHPPV